MTDDIEPAADLPPVTGEAAPLPVSIIEATVTEYPFAAAPISRVIVGFLLIGVLSLSGCGGERVATAKCVANAYAAAEAASQGADLQATTTAIRLLCQEVAKRQGFTITGAEAWIASLKQGAKP